MAESRLVESEDLGCTARPHSALCRGPRCSLSFGVPFYLLYIYIFPSSVREYKDRHKPSFHAARPIQARFPLLVFVPSLTNICGTGLVG